MEYTNFKQLFSRICEIKQNVVKLNSKDLVEYRRNFFRLHFQEWQLTLLWEFIWDDKPYEEVKQIFESKKLI